MTTQTKPATLGRSGDATALKSRWLPARTIGRLYVGNNSGTAFYLQIHDLSQAAATAALATNTAVPAYPAIKVPADTTVIIPEGFSLRDGCLLAASSTRGTLTLVSGNDAEIVVES